MGLQSVFALPDGSLPAASRMPSYERDCKQGKEASSRIDDFLCTRRCGLANAAATMEQLQVLTDNIFRTSDHRPILLQFKYGDVFASPPTQPPRRPPPRPALKKALTAEQIQRWKEALVSRSRGRRLHRLRCKGDRAHHSAWHRGSQGMWCRVPRTRPCGGSTTRCSERSAPGAHDALSEAAL